MCLADHHNESSGRCDPSLPTIAMETGCNVKTARQAVRDLAAMGAFSVEHRSGLPDRITFDFTAQPLPKQAVVPRQVPLPKTTRTPTKNGHATPTSFGTLPLPKQVPEPEGTRKIEPEENQKRDGQNDVVPAFDFGSDGSGRSPSDCAVDEWNIRAKQWGWPVAQKRDPKRMQAVSARLGDLKGLSGWDAMLAKAESSKFVREQMHNWSLDWVTNPTNLRKLMEGNYDDKRNAKPDTGLLAVLAALGPETAG